MQLSSPSKGKIYKTKDILDTFRYYSSLYSIQGHYRDLSPTALQSKMNVYLKENSLPSIPLDRKAKLESDITLEELYTAVKALKNGKSTGPDGLYLHFY